jgi:ketosteroid isomerase-like protein
MVDNQRESTVAAVEARMRSFEAAERDLDAERALAHFAPVPEFHVYNDGRLVTYDQVVAGVRGGFPRVRAMETPFTNVRALVLNPEHVLVSASLRRTVTDSAGIVTRSHGAATWLWRRIDAQWFIVYGQLDHRPDPDT